MKYFKMYLPLFLIAALVILMLSLFSQSDQLSQPEVASLTDQNNSVAAIDETVTINIHFLYGIIFDIVTMMIIFGFIYFPNYRNKEFMFTFYLFNIIIFIITFVLNKTSISMGAAFGLFAVFSMLRYRTMGISMKEMTYLLIAIAVGLINAIGLSLIPLIVFNLIVLLYIFILDHPFVFKQEISKTIVYENIELLRPENHHLMMEDIRLRTGFNIHRFTILSVNFLRDTAKIIVYYYKTK
jgi:hypothetical protein